MSVMDETAKKRTLRSSDLKEAAVAREQWNRYITARDRGHKDYVRRAELFDRYYLGNQWDEDTTAELDAEGRPHLTINLTMATINAFKEQHRQRRVDIVFKPTHKGSVDTAAALTKLFKIEYNRNFYQWVEGQVLSDGMIQERGFFDCRMDFEENINGELKITSLDPMEVILPPEAKEYDPKTWPEVITTRWVSLDDIEQTYGKRKADKLQFIVDAGGHYTIDSVDFEGERAPTFGTDEYGVEYARDIGSEEPRTIRAVRLIERQHRKLQRVDLLVDPTTGDSKPAPQGWNERQTRKFAKKFGLEVISRVQSRIRWTVTCDHIVLHDDWSPYDDFTVVPYFPYFRRGKPTGMVTQLVSLQDQLNKSESQLLHIVNSTANGGWLIESESLVNMTPDELETNGSKTGLVVEYRRGTTAPAKIQPNQIPTGVDRIAGRAVVNMRQISGVNEAVAGTESAQVSGVSLEKKSTAGKEIMQVPLDTLEQTRYILAGVALRMIQRFYTDERIYFVTQDDPEEEDEELAINQEQADGTIANDITLGKYEVTVSTAPARDTMDDIQYAEALNLRKVGVMIPDDAIIMRSNLQDKYKLAKRIRLMQGIDQTPEQAEAMAIQNEIAMLEAQKQLQLLDADIALKMAQAELAAAKAGVEVIKPDMELQRLMNEREMRQKEIDLRDRLAKLSAASKDRSVETSSAAKLALTAMQVSAKAAESANKPPKESK